MTKTELIEEMSKEGALSKREAERILNVFVKVVTDHLKNGEKVAVTGFGTFKVSNRKPRKGVNPQNPSEKITIPAVKVPKFTAGKTLKDQIR